MALTIPRPSRKAGQLVPFPAQPEPDPDSEAAMIALMTREYSEHDVRVKAMWRAIEDKRKAGKYCASGTNSYLRMSLLPEMNDDYTPKAAVEPPEKDLGNEHYDYYTMDGLRALRQRRLAAWKAQMAGFRSMVLKALENGAIKPVTQERVFAEFGLAPVRQITRKSAVIRVNWTAPEGDTSTNAETQRQLQAAVAALAPGATWVGRNQHSGTTSYVEVTSSTGRG